MKEGVAAKEGKEGGWGKGGGWGQKGERWGEGCRHRGVTCKGDEETKGRRDDKKVVRAVCMVPLHPRAKRKDFRPREVL